MTAAAAQFLRYGLLALLGWSAAVLVVVEGGLGARYSLHPEDASSVEALPVLDLVEAESALKPLEGYTQVGARPLFNPDRRPLPPPAAQGGTDETAAPPPPAAFDVVLTSVALHGDVKVAVLTDKTTNKSQSVRLGSALQGELSGWTLKELKPRQAVFDGPGGSRTVDLRVFDGQGGEAPTAVEPAAAVIQPTPEQPQQAAQSGAATTDETMTPEQRAELIRQRIEERRRQMREEAARASQEKSQ